MNRRILLASIALAACSAGWAKHGVSSSYFPVVVTLGIQAAQDTKVTAGLSGTLANGQIASGNKPAGSTFSASDGSGNQPTLSVTAPSTFASYDFTGVELDVDGTGSVSITNCQFDTISGQFLQAWIGGNSGAPTVSFTNCTFSGAAASTLFEALVRVPAGAVTFTACRFISAPLDFADLIGSGVSLSFNLCYFGPPGNNPPSMAHIEAVHPQAGNLTVDLCWFDFTGGRVWPGGASPGWTGALQLEGGGTVTITRSIFSAGTPGGAGLAALDVPYPIQNSNALTLNNCAIQTGTSSYVAHNAGSVSASGNRDFDANTAITP